MLETIFSVQNGSAWLDLDEKMKFKLRFWGASSIVTLLIIILFSIYSYAMWFPVKSIIDSIWIDIKESVQEKDEIPGYIITVGTLLFIIAFIFSSIFFYFLVDFAKIHYKIDKITFRIIPKIGEHIRSEILTKLDCCDKNQCELIALNNTKSGKRKILDAIFYHFANMDLVGTHNQKDKRKQVFSFYTQYYVFNYIMLILFILLLWFCFLSIMYWPVLWSVILILVAFITLFFWYFQGKKYRNRAFELADDQISSFFFQSKQTVYEQAASLVDNCNNPNCKVKPWKINSK